MTELDGSASDITIGNASCPYPQALYPSYINGVSFAIISRSIVEGFRFKLYNRTDGDVVFSETRVTFMKIG